MWNAGGLSARQFRFRKGKITLDAIVMVVKEARQGTAGCRSVRVSNLGNNMCVIAHVLIILLLLIYILIRNVY